MFEPSGSVGPEAASAERLARTASRSVYATFVGACTQEATKETASLPRTGRTRATARAYDLAREARTTPSAIDSSLVS